MKAKKTLEKVIAKELDTLKISEVQIILNYIINLENEIRRLSALKKVPIEIIIEDK